MNRTKINVALTLVATLTLTCPAAGTAHAQQVGKYRSNGAYASASGADATGCRFFTVWVGRGGTAAAPQTFLSYGVFDACTGMSSWGNGPIINTAFKTTNKTATLHTSGAIADGFYTEGESFAIDLVFARDDMVTEIWSGHSRMEYYGHVVQHHGSWTRNNAAASGTIGGAALQASWAEMGTSRDHYVEFDRGGK